MTEKKEFTIEFKPIITCEMKVEASNYQEAMDLVVSKIENSTFKELIESYFKEDSGIVDFY